MPPKATVKHARLNSPEFVTRFADLLDFTYRNDVSRIYLFKLADVPGKGLLGFFDSNGNPKESYYQLLEIYDVVKEGYKVEKSANFIKIIGRNSTIKVALTDTQESISSQKVKRTSSKSSYSGSLKKAEWVKYDNK